MVTVSVDRMVIASTDDASLIPAASAALDAAMMPTLSVEEVTPTQCILQVRTTYTLDKKTVSPT